MSRNPNLPKKLKSRNTREADWEPLKTRIIELHISQGLSLQEVRETLRNEAGFDATVRQYRSRISKWNLDKNVKSYEMKFIAQKQEHRRITEPNKASLHFRVRGLPVDPSKIERWKARTGFDASTPVSPHARPNTPSGLSYATDSEDQSPPGSPIKEEHKFSFITESFSREPSSSYTESKMDFESTPFNVFYDKCRWINQVYRSLQLATSTSELQEELLLPQNMEGLMENWYLDDQTEASLCHTLSDLEGHHGIGHPNTLEIQEKLACSLLRQRQWKPAEEVIVRLLDSSRQRYGDQHENTVWAIKLLGDSVLGQRQWARAERIHQNAYDLMASTVGPEAPRTLGCLAALADNLSIQTRHREASPLSLRLFESSFKLFGQDHPLTVVRAAKLAESYFHTGQYDKAEALFLHVLSVHTNGPIRRVRPNKTEITQVA